MSDLQRTAPESADRRTIGAWTVSVAPMMDCTDRHCRYLMRLLSPSARLYTEMITAQALAHADPHRLLDYDASEHPVALQLGGSQPELLQRAARLGAEWGYDEINLNVGCPSERVQSGSFGACLMAEPQLVVECLQAIREVVRVPVTVKCRIGIDELDDYGFFEHFVHTVAAGGTSVFIVHARKALLQGLTPKENREIPPLRYEFPIQLKRQRPQLTVVLNGGLGSVADVKASLREVDGVMLGRAVYDRPYLLAELHAACADPGAVLPHRGEIVARYAEYVAARQAEGHRLPLMLRHVQGLYAGQAGARAWRRFLGEQGRIEGADARVLPSSLPIVEPAARAHGRA